jgi:acylphosphatase
MDDDMTEPLITIHAIVSGKVQGVFYRDTARRKAQLANITGWAKNLTDGRVEIMASGKQAVVKEFADWLWEGSPASRVENVECEQVPHHEFDSFLVKRD